jgi:hypothetical protein
MAVKTSECCINTETFSHASGSVSYSLTPERKIGDFFPTQVGFSQCKKDIAISGVFFVTHFMTARAVQRALPSHSV